ncbi:hypothetical protein H6P81_009254 [Aristolochia fimbriata]|uniref:Uncharacterized protein n=1 Tax=Aristolochia fimbriata TaxID=158543 RepID=A0AAV7ELM8_ARIFI|nr:hypothetical protein H6P81_009254 [Aristolochia fimbriata]
MHAFQMDLSTYPCEMNSPARYCNSSTRMHTPLCFGNINFHRLCGLSTTKLCRFLLFRVNPFCRQLCYFLLVTFLGFLLLKALDVRDPSFRPRDIDLFFTSVSAVTVSSMSTIEMEVFSNAQLVVITVLMLVGGEVFFSMLDCLVTKAKLRERREIKIEPSNNINAESKVELGLVVFNETKTQLAAPNYNSILSTEAHGQEELRYRCVTYLSFVLLGYLLIAHLGGSLVVFLYVTLVPSARHVLDKKGIEGETFAVFTVVSSFANCGFVPTNENMVVFRKNSGLLLLLVPLFLGGNTLFPCCLRFVLWVLRRVTKRVEFDRMLEKPEEMGSDQLLEPLHCLLLVPTVIGFILVQVIVFCAVEWRSEGLSGMNTYEKIVGALFQSANSRHTGETIVDIATLAPAILVLFVVMMYLPPYTSFLPVSEPRKNDRKLGWMKSLVLSPISYLSLCVILISLTENSKMREDPINFSVLNVVLEVTSAYGNVGFTMGYSCQRRLKQEGHCKDTWYGFVGRWSDAGKLILIFVMLLGRMKKFNLKGGKAWKLR